jgi:hypothetical protein
MTTPSYSSNIIDAVVRRVVYAGNGVGPYSFSFRCFTTSDVAVYVGTTKQTLTTHYSVSLNSNGTGTVTLTSSANGGATVTSSHTVVLVSNISVERGSDFSTGGDFFASTINEDLDKQTLFSQQLEEQFNRTLAVPVTEPVANDLTLPENATRKGKVLAFNSSTGLPEMGPTIADTTSVANATTNIGTVAGAVSNVNTVAGINANISTVAGIASNVTTVAGISSNVTTVAGIASNVTSVANNEANVNRYASEYTISSSAPGSPSEGDLWYDSTNNILKYYSGSEFIGIVGDTDKLVSVSANDSTPGVLNGKLVAGSNITLTEGSDGSNETLAVAFNSGGSLTIKNPSTSDDTPAVVTLQTGDTDIAAADKLGVINFQAPDEATGTDAILVAAGIEAVSEGDFSASSNATKLSFKTASSEAATEKMSLSSAGLLTIADDLVIGDGKTIGSSSDADAITIASDGKVTLAEIATVSKGIAFPATQVASTDGNTLDDYEEGTWTPTIVGGTSAGSYTLNSSFDDGYYQKIGRMVTVRAIIQLSSIGSAGSGAYLFGGLPFNIDVSHNAGAGTLVMDDVATGRTAANIIGIGVTNPSGSDGDKLRVTIVEDDASFQTLQISQAASADFFEFTYHYATTA